ncbi:MAG: hypothetical protein KBT06_04230 [Prevotellaceae bacterium]|nr:hypothetical protein [Candidatus Colivivens equi]
MKEIENNQQGQEVSPFVEGVIKWFQTLMEKYTHGKYSSEEEKAFFSNDSNLYDEKGEPTPEYKEKIKEFEAYIEKNDVDSFLNETHSIDTEEFGKAYNSSELQILDSACSFINDQQQIVLLLKKAKQKALLKRTKFDFDEWFKDYASKNDITQDNIEEAKKAFLGDIDTLLKEDEELLKFVKESFKNDVEEN